MSEENLNLPVTQVPVASPIAIDVEELSELCGRLNLFKVAPSAVRIIAALGQSVEKLGVVKTVKGNTLMGQHAVASCVLVLSADLESAGTLDDKMKVAYAIGKLSEQMAKIGKMVMETQDLVAEGGGIADKQRRRGPAPGAVVGVTGERVEVHMHQSRE